MERGGIEGEAWERALGFWDLFLLKRYDTPLALGIDCMSSTYFYG